MPCLTYILDGHRPVPEPDLVKYSQWYATAERHVGYTLVGENTSVSTVFLGINHNHSDLGGPILFETMIFGDAVDEEYQVRCRTWEEAEANHQEAIEYARRRLRLEPDAVQEVPSPEAQAKILAAVAAKTVEQTKPTWHQRLLDDDDES